MEIILKKYHGLGNDYIIYDPNRNKLDLNTKRVRLICDRHFGVGSDGILFGPIWEGGQIKLRIFNPDGSEAEKSGNGVRIFSKYLKDSGYIKDKSFVLNTLGGNVNVEYLNKNGDLLKVSMGKTTFLSDKIPVTGPSREVIDELMTFNNKEYRVTCLSIGNPHCIIPMENISKEKASELGKYVESSRNFPNRINMQLLKVMDRDNIQIEIYERGAGYTLASGSSSSAAATAAYKLGLINNKVTVHMPGGNLKIEIQNDSTVFMTGTVNAIGSINLSEQFIDELLKI
ncbi:MULTISPECIES: diaminopimelate epimerase [Clostridium]|uniref:Diaminopimelate epimerase n=1 Tax=Clostridium cibarium TaxID=2762247 RepID=A0ABR8PUQ0_9CLOT|nr:MULTISPECIES: diaminopimelate epimerase [Clostridium]MBD7911859.1 diaminopimelate epimerase [Clostridium cibarium]